MLTIHLRQLSIGYGDKTVARHLEETIVPGALTCLLGRNGAGKSTLLRTIAGLQPPLGGKVIFEDSEGREIDMARQSKSQLAKMVSVVLTERPDVQQFTVEELVGMGRLPYTGFFGGLNEADRQVVANAMELTGITPFAHRQVQALSDGERQKVMIAKALAQQTPIILLDEPTAFLDYPSKVETLKLLSRLAQEQQLTLVLSTHDLELALRLGQRFITLDGELHETTREELREYVGKSALNA
jgi:iron complex transport system ATP-binding protein